MTLVLVIGIWYWWLRNAGDGSMNNGGVVSTDSPVSTKEKMDTGAVDLDGAPMTSGSNPYGRNASSGSTGSSGVSGTTAPVVAANPAAVNTALSAAATPNTQAPSNAVVSTVSSAANTAASTVKSILPSSAPTGDTLTANAPQGMAFGGSGKFQWYRQGNITWRINTQTGSSCVAFATMEEWHKPIVISHGCGDA